MTIAIFSIMILLRETDKGYLSKATHKCLGQILKDFKARGVDSDLVEKLRLLQKEGKADIDLVAEIINQTSEVFRVKFNADKEFKNLCTKIEKYTEARFSDGPAEGLYIKGASTKDLLFDESKRKRTYELKKQNYPQMWREAFVIANLEKIFDEKMPSFYSPVIDACFLGRGFTSPLLEMLHAHEVIADANLCRARNITKKTQEFAKSSGAMKHLEKYLASHYNALLSNVISDKDPLYRNPLEPHRLMLGILAFGPKKEFSSERFDKKTYSEWRGWHEQLPVIHGMRDMLLVRYFKQLDQPYAKVLELAKRATLDVYIGADGRPSVNKIIESPLGNMALVFN